MSLLPSTTGVVSLLFALRLAAQVNVLTYQYDASRVGVNPNEPLLTLSNVNSNQFAKLFSDPVDGAIYGQPLYLAGVEIPGKGFHNVVYIVTEHDSVYAFDADSNAGVNAAPLWQVSFLGTGVTTVPASDVGCGQISPEIGITSTPVIDPASGTLYLVAMTKESTGGAPSYVHRLHALDVATGAEKSGSPVAIQATYPGTGEGGNTLVFAPMNYKQRPGLLLLSGVVYTAWSSHCDIGTYHGWLIGYDATTLKQVSVYNNTPDANGASFWAGGAAPAADADGNIYVVGGNGIFDSSGSDLGESYIKLSSGPLSVLDYFTPFNFQPLDDADLDVGSAGVALLPDDAGSSSHPHLMIGAGKEGRIYVLDRDNMGKWQAGSDSQIVASLPGTLGGLFGKPAYFNQTAYFCATQDSLKAFPLAAAKLAGIPSSQSQASFDFPGCVPTISSNGASNAIVWALDPAGVLRAYDASNLGNEIYDSNQQPDRDVLGGYVKFSAPIVANGKVFAATPSALVVYGLPTTLGVQNAASSQENIASPGSLLSIFGEGLAQSTDWAAGFPLPYVLAGATVAINNVPAPILYASPTQINLQVPFEIAAGGASVTISVSGKAVGSASFVAGSGNPGLFLRTGGRAAALNRDGSRNTPSQPASVGSSISVYATGLGAVDNPVPTGTPGRASPLSHATSTVTATIGGTPATVLFAGLAPDFVGLYQVNIRIPELATGDYPLVVSVGGIASNPATVSVH
jgi:uncharacterized protein (TIGR03437 family)